MLSAVCAPALPIGAIIAGPEPPDGAGTRLALCHPGRVLRSMRDRDGGPRVRVRLLALVVALLLAGPLTLLVVQTVAKVLDRAL